MRNILLTALFLLASAALIAQAAPAADQTKPAPAGQTQPAAAPDAEAAAPQDNLGEMVKDELLSSDTIYRYDPRGRRDPFRGRPAAAAGFSRGHAPRRLAVLLLDDLLDPGLRHDVLLAGNGQPQHFAPQTDSAFTATARRNAPTAERASWLRE